MTQRVLTFTSCQNLQCGTLPQALLVCVASTKVRPEACPEEAEGASRSYVEGTLIKKVQESCSTCPSWMYWFGYDDAQLIDNYILQGGDVLGFSCKGCVGEYADQRAGAEVRVYFNDANEMILVTQHGCEYNLGLRTLG